MRELKKKEKDNELSSGSSFPADIDFCRKPEGFMFGPGVRRWIFFVAKRISRVDGRHFKSATSRLASIGVLFGVMALIITLSVMNGFQMSFIDSILELSSYHVQVEGVEQFHCDMKNVKSIVPFYEAQGLMAGAGSSQCGAIVRAVPHNVMEIDEGFKKEMKIVSGSFDLAEDDSIIIGNGLARSLGLRKGSFVDIVALSGSSETAMLSDNRKFTVKGIFYSGYSGLNSTYAFIRLSDGEKYFGKNSPLRWGIKIDSSSNEGSVVSSLKKQFPDSSVTSWKEYNRSFFGTLRIEKNMLFLLVFMIFIVVAVNIYNSMKKLVFERRDEIAMMSVFGGRPCQVQMVFVAKGAITGLAGAVPGLVLGILVSRNMKVVFSFLAKVQYFIEYAGARIFSPENAFMVTENPMFAVYGSIPARMIPGEVLVIFLFGVMSSLLASLLASRDVLKMTVTEILRNE